MSITHAALQPVVTSHNHTVTEPDVKTQNASSTSTTTTATVQAPTTSSLQRLLADQENLKNLASRLRGIVPWVKDGFLASDWLNKNTLRLHEHSSKASAQTTPQTFTSVITDLGYDLPRTADEFTALAQKLEQKASLHPLGDFGGALSWPMPISQQDQIRIVNFLHSNNTGLPGLPLPRDGDSTIGYLLRGSSLTSSDLHNPALALQKLIDSPKGQALGKALQTHLNGASSDISIYDYVLAAIHLGLDQASSRHPERNKVAGVVLHESSYWGASPSLAVKSVSDQLVANSKATATTVKLATHLLLARSYPQFLIKDIPPTVTYGSTVWTQLTLAVAKIEAQTPGRVPNMTYAEVIAAAESMPTDSYAVQSAQREALRNWGVVSGMLDLFGTQPSEPEIEKVRNAYNNQLKALTNASSLMQTPWPSRKEIALNCLKAEFPGVDPAVFEAKVLKLLHKNSSQAPFVFPERRSMLDIAMEGERLEKNHSWVTDDTRIPISRFNAYVQSDNFHAARLFKDEYKNTLKAQADGHHERVKYLTSTLSLEDRRNLDSGKLEFFHTNDYKVDMDFTSPLALSKRGNTLHVKTTRGGEVNIYCLDTSKGTFEKANHLKSKFTEPYSGEKLDKRNANIVSRTKLFAPPYAGTHADEIKNPPAIPDSYNSDRTSFIADVFVKSLALDNEDLLNHAKGVTSFDKNRSLNAAIGEFFLNLIPLRSAIVNFQNHKIGEGLFDLFFDVVGLVTLGAGKAAQATKILGTGLHAATKAVKTVKFLGVAAIEALNPLGGVGDLAVGVGGLLGKGFSYLSSKGRDAIIKLKGLTGSYDGLKAASKTHGVAATGTYKVAGQTIEGGAVFQEGKWYAYDPVSDRRYGPALKDFKPTVAAHDGDIRAVTDSWLGKMIGAVVAPAAVNPNFLDDFVSALAKAKAEDKAAYIRGQNTGKPEAIYGYSPALKINDLKRLAVAERRTPTELGSLVKRIGELEALPERFKTARETAQVIDADGYKRGYDAGGPEGISGFSKTLSLNQYAELGIARGRTPEELGRLVKYMEKRRIDVDLENYRVFHAEITAAGGKAVPMPQSFYLSQSQVSLLSEGECAAISNVMAAAAAHPAPGKQDIFMKNMYAAMVPALSPSEIAELRKINPNKAIIEQRRSADVNKFREQLNQIQEVLGDKFHHTMQARQVTPAVIISELAKAGKSSTSKTLLIHGPGHGITAGYNARTREWFYFDPNFGKATFTTEAAMSAALESTLNSGLSSHLMPHFTGTTRGTREYKMSVFEDANLNSTIKGTGVDLSFFYRDNLFKTTL
ncbi:hypothetical protein ACDZ94_24820 (plasmid) [Pseudomonas sp. UBT]|uniref:hypothetical protein n=1 Tax=Pseudomonas sp. UBT TaxID=3239198 RepID=UPI003D800C50